MHKIKNGGVKGNFRTWQPIPKGFEYQSMAGWIKKEREIVMANADDIALTINEVLIRDLKEIQEGINSCTELSQARGLIHNRLEVLEAANLELKSKL